MRFLVVYALAALLAMSSVAFANDVTVTLNCTTCHVNSQITFTANVTDEDGSNVQGEQVFYRIADGGVITDLLTVASVTNSSGNAQFTYTPSSIGDLMVQVELEEDGTSQTITPAIVQ